MVGLFGRKNKEEGGHVTRDPSAMTTTEQAPSAHTAPRRVQTNRLVDFLRHYGPIAASDNMYDELIQTEISRHNIDPPIEIEPARLSALIDNFNAAEPDNVILTGTAGDGKTYHCRRVWEALGGDPARWRQGDKLVRLNLPESGRPLMLVKDLSELSSTDKAALFPELAAAIAGDATEHTFLVAANDGQLIASWREWAEAQGARHFQNFKVLEEMLVENRSSDIRLRLKLYNLSRLDASTHFDALVEQVVEHPQWINCAGCELMDADGSTKCPIRINQELLRDRETSPFRQRLMALLRLAGTNRLHLPIRDLLLLCVNVILGDQQPGQPLLTCRKAKNRAETDDYALTNPYANALGANLSEKDRQKYQVFMVLDGFGIGSETDNRFDNLLIYGSYNETDQYNELVGDDPYYGAPAYRHFLRGYLEGERASMKDFMAALERQRQRLFFSLPPASSLDPWHLSVYRAAGVLLDFADKVKSGEDITRITEQLVRGLNRTFCGMMIDDGAQLYLASSGGDGRGRIATVLNHTLSTAAQKRNIYVAFKTADDGLTPRLVVLDPARSEGSQQIDYLDLQLTHFEYLVRVSNGSLPASFSRQCYEDFLDFKLRLIERLDPLVGEESDEREVSLKALRVDEHGRPQVDAIRIRVGAP